MSHEARIVEVSLAEIADDLARGIVTAEALTRAYIARIEINDSKLKSVLALNPRAVEESRAADQRRRNASPLSALDGVPVLIKDNIDIQGLATTAGSLALSMNIPSVDAPVVAALRAAGMVVLGKANLSEWANIRSARSTSGWSAVGGLTRNPYDPSRSASGSSSGSAAAVAASFAPAAIGTETDGSIVWPAAVCGVVGLKPTLNLLPQKGIVPISHAQDTAGPMARDVRDTALLLGAMVGGSVNYGAGLNDASLKGMRFGVLRFMQNFTAETTGVFETALDQLRAQGASIIDIDAFDMKPITDNFRPVLLTEFKADVNTYLAGSHPDVTARTLADVIAFNRATPQELEWFGQDFFEAAQQTQGLDTPSYLAARAMMRDAAGIHGIDRMMHEHRVNMLLAPTNDPAWRITLGAGDLFGGSSSTLAATAGYPHLTVPAGYIDGLPVGLSFIGTAGAEASLLAAGFAFERAANARRPPTL